MWACFAHSGTDPQNLGALPKLSQLSYAVDVPAHNFSRFVRGTLQQQARPWWCTTSVRRSPVSQAERGSVSTRGVPEPLRRRSTPLVPRSRCPRTFSISSLNPMSSIWSASSSTMNSASVSSSVPRPTWSNSLPGVPTTTSRPRLSASSCCA